MTEISFKKLGTLIKKRRLSLGLSQEELGERAGLHRTYICDVEQGTRNLSLGTLQRLARALDISSSQMLRDTEESDEIFRKTAGGIPV